MKRYTIYVDLISKDGALFIAKHPHTITYTYHLMKQITNIESPIFIHQKYLCVRTPNEYIFHDFLKYSRPNKALIERLFPDEKLKFQVLENIINSAIRYNPLEDNLVFAVGKPPGELIIP